MASVGVTAAHPLFNPDSGLMAIDAHGEYDFDITPPPTLASRNVRQIPAWLRFQNRRSLSQRWASLANGCGEVDGAARLDRGL